MEPKTQTDQTTSPTEPDEAGRIGRLASEVRGLIDDVRTWVDLKLKLLEAEVEERVREVMDRVAVTVVVGVLAFLSLIFVLVTGALALGSWWDNLLLGFLAVSVLLVLMTGLVYGLRSRLVRTRKRAARAGSSRPEVQAAPDRPQLPKGSSDEQGETGHG